MNSRKEQKDSGIRQKQNQSFVSPGQIHLFYLLQRTSNEESTCI